MKTRPGLSAAAAWIDARPLAERRLISLVGVALIVAVWFSLAQRPVLSALDATRQQTLDLQARTAETRGAFDALNQSLQTDPDLARRNQLEHLRAELTRLERRLDEKALAIIAPDQMVRALRDLLDDQSGLTLESLENLAAEPAFADAPAAGTGQGEPGGLPLVYRHRVRIALHGDYLAVMRYVDSLERLPWRFQWDSFSIEMDTYPKARVVMYLNTLSLGPNWIGT